MFDKAMEQLKRGAQEVGAQLRSSEPTKSSTMPRFYIREGSNTAKQYLQTVHGNFIRKDLARVPGNNRREKKQFLRRNPLWNKARKAIV